jgi:hypothetical protein
MIFSLTEYDVYHWLSNQSAISNLLTLEPWKPADDLSWTYWWISIVSNESKSPSNKWFLYKTARISIIIVSPKNIPDDDTAESIIDTIIDTITNTIVWEHDQKDIDRNWKGVSSCIEWPTSPMLYDVKDRPRRVKDYFITYIASDG